MPSADKLVGAKDLEIAKAIMRGPEKARSHDWVNAIERATDNYYGGTRTVSAPVGGLSYTASTLGIK